MLRMYLNCATQSYELLAFSYFCLFNKQGHPRFASNSKWSKMTTTYWQHCTNYFVWSFELESLEYYFFMKIYCNHFRLWRIEGCPKTNYDFTYITVIGKYCIRKALQSAFCILDVNCNCYAHNLLKMAMCYQKKGWVD